MEYYVRINVSSETVTQIVKFYTFVKNNFKTDLSDCIPCSEWTRKTLNLYECILN